MDLGLAAKVVLVTGASRGIGRAIAETFASEGAYVALNARGMEGLLESQAAIGDVQSSIHPADICEKDEASRLVKSVIAKWGRLDVLVCNVGGGASVRPGEETDKEWRRVLDLNLLATTSTIAAARLDMRNEVGSSAIVAVSSICGLAALGAPVTYSAAKAALNATVRGLARPLAREGIRINAVAPGNIVFPGGTWWRKLSDDPGEVAAMLEREVALRRLGKPQEVADMVAFLASPRAAFITGSIVVADGGQLRS